MPETNLTDLHIKAVHNITDTLTIALEYAPPHKALVIYDAEHPLTCLLTDAYRVALPDAEFVDFNTLTKEDVIARCDALAPRDLVVLIQSTDFRLNEFRIRIHLFQHKLKVIDHRHLFRNTTLEMYETYINALAYDPHWYRGVGRRLKEKLEQVDVLTIESGDAVLTVPGGLEIPKPNLGDYAGMENIGGTFPIGEVFTEAKNLFTVNGSLMVYGFADTSFNIQMHEPFRIDIRDGIVVSWDDSAPESFCDVVEQIKTHERVLVREIGFGLNRAISREKYLSDITAFERVYGLHVSLGEKHTVYKKEGIQADKTRFHVDLFVCADRVLADDECIFKRNTYLV